MEAEKSGIDFSLIGNVALNGDARNPESRPQRSQQVFSPPTMLLKLLQSHVELEEARTCPNSGLCETRWLSCSVVF